MIPSGVALLDSQYCMIAYNGERWSTYGIAIFDLSAPRRRLRFCRALFEDALLLLRLGDVSELADEAKANYMSAWRSFHAGNVEGEQRSTPRIAPEPSGPFRIVNRITLDLSPANALAEEERGLDDGLFAYAENARLLRITVHYDDLDAELHPHEAYDTADYCDVHVTCVKTIRQMLALSARHATPFQVNKSAWDDKFSSLSRSRGPSMRSSSTRVLRDRSKEWDSLRVSLLEIHDFESPAAIKEDLGGRHAKPSREYAESESGAFVSWRPSRELPAHGLAICHKDSLCLGDDYLVVVRPSRTIAAHARYVL